MAKKIREWPDESDLSEIMVKVLSPSGQPLTAREIRRQLPGPFKIPEDLLSELLTNLILKRNLFEWPSKGKGAKRFWTEPPSQAFISTIITQALSEKPLTPPEMKKILNKRLFGLSPKMIEPVVQTLMEQGTILLHPKTEGLKAKLGLHPPDPKPYLRKVIKELAQVIKTLAPCRVSPKEIGKVLCDSLNSPGDPIIDQARPQTPALEEEILTKMIAVEPQAPYGALVSISNLRRTVNMEKVRFDQTIIGLARKNKLILHRHSFPQGLTEEERNFLVDDQKGNWYVGAVLVANRK
jgi:hypothetical protein